jgi:arginyl-tRNA synthetase
VLALARAWRFESSPGHHILFEKSIPILVLACILAIDEASMNIFETAQRIIAHALDALIRAGKLPNTLDLSRVMVEPPKDAHMGDISTNVAMSFAKEAKMAPRALAQLIIEILQELPEASSMMASIDVAGPGFINITLTDTVLLDVVNAVQNLGTGYGLSQMGQNTPVNVEYVSANPTGPMHVGHGRGAVFGDSLSTLLARAGFSVTREYYINDAGAQVDVLAHSTFLRYREALGEEIGAIPEGLYPGDYLVPVGRELARIHGNVLIHLPQSEWLPIVRNASIEAMMHMIREDLAAIGIEHDVFFSERSLSAGETDHIAATIAYLREKGLVYEGILPPPKGQIDEEWEEREQTLFRSTPFGDDVDRALLKSDGSYTYFASDIAYHKSKYDRGFKNMIDVWGADHGGYVTRMQAAVEALSAGKANLDVKLCQMVRLMRHGEPVKMSKRAGDFVTLREVIDEVGRDAVRFMMLFRKNDAPLDFDLAKVVEQSKDNPVFYVQYAHARCCSVLRQAQEAFPHTSFQATQALKAYTDEADKGVIRLLSQYPRQIEAAASAHEPHRIAFYLYELASAFHSHWNKGKDQPELRFVHPENRALTCQRLGLIHAVRLVLASGLDLLGVSAPEEMR